MARKYKFFKSIRYDSDSAIPKEENRSPCVYVCVCWGRCVSSHTTSPSPLQGKQCYQDGINISILHIIFMQI